MTLIDITTLMLIILGFILSYRLGEMNGLEKRMTLKRSQHKHGVKYKLPTNRR